MASKFDHRKLLQRRFEIQMHYHAAYLFWGLRGALAERWGHGPHFGAFAASDNELQLTRQTGAPADLVAAVGLKRAVFIAEGSSVDSGPDLATAWMDDVLQTLKPQRVTRVVLRNLYAYALSDPDQASEALMRDFPSVADFVPTGFGVRHGGLQYQIVEQEGETTVRRSVIFGVYGPHQQREFFNLIDANWHLGFHHMVEWVSDEAGLDAPDRLLDKVTTAFSEEARSEARRQISRVMSHA